jgi:hypothetical protein
VLHINWMAMALVKSAEQVSAVADMLSAATLLNPIRSNSSTAVVSRNHASRGAFLHVW